MSRNNAHKGSDYEQIGGISHILATLQTVQNFSQLDADGGPTLPKTKTDGALARESLYNKDYFICFGIKTHEVEDHKGWPVACCWPTDSAAAAEKCDQIFRVALHNLWRSKLRSNFSCK